MENEKIIINLLNNMQKNNENNQKIITDKVDIVTKHVKILYNNNVKLNNKISHIEKKIFNDKTYNVLKDIAENKIENKEFKKNIRHKLIEKIIFTLFGFIISIITFIGTKLFF